MDSARAAEENTSYVMKLMPDRSTIDIVKLGIAAAIAGLLVGSIFWATIRPDRVQARDTQGVLMAAEPIQATNVVSGNSTVAPAELRR